LSGWTPPDERQVNDPDARAGTVGAGRAAVYAAAGGRWVALDRRVPEDL